MFMNKMEARYNIDLNPSEETVVICTNFSDKELRILLLEKLNLNPVIYYEYKNKSQIDKVFEFNEKAVFHNIIIPRDDIKEEPIIATVIKKDKCAVIIVKEMENDTFKIPEELISRFKFKLKRVVNMPLSMQNLQVPGDHDESSFGSDGEMSSSSSEPEVQDTELGKVIISKLKTIKPDQEEQLNIEYILFWLSNEGLKRIENFIQLELLPESNELHTRSNEDQVKKKEFSKILDEFESRLMIAQNLGDSKRRYFVKLLDSELPTVEFRYLIRYLKSRMGNLYYKSVMIERELKLARNTFAVNLDADTNENSERLDYMMKIFASIATMFLPLQLISGMWGMNVRVPWQGEDNEWPFYSI